MFARLTQVCRYQLIPQARRFAQVSGAPKVKSSSSTTLVHSVEKDQASKMLHVHWKNHTRNRFPFVYLRDNCQCSQCVDQSSNRRAIDTVGEADIDLEAEKVEVLPNGAQISIVWPDKHVSVFESDWLHKRSMPEKMDSPSERRNIVKKGVELWDGARLQGKIPDFEFQELMEDDLQLMHWLKTLHSFGITLVKNTPTETGQVRKLTERVGPFKGTHFGDTFRIFLKSDGNDVAFTSGPLPLHSDLSYYDYTGGVQMLHCIEQVPSTGGSNMFADGFNVSQKLKEAEPQLFQLLATTPIQYHNVVTTDVGEFNFEISHPVIELDHTGRITRFSYSDYVRDSIFNVTPDVAKELYKGFITIGRMLRDPAYQIDHKMCPGDIIVFNNIRVLHGRTGYKITAEGNRYIEGNYIDWDMVYSRLRVLTEKYSAAIDV